MKSGMLVAIVAQPPVIEDREERMSQERAAPETLYSCFQIVPEPPAFKHMAITTAIQVIETTTGALLVRDNHQTGDETNRT